MTPQTPFSFALPRATLRIARGLLKGEVAVTECATSALLPPQMLTAAILSEIESTLRAQRIMD